MVVCFFRSNENCIDLNIEHLNSVYTAIDYCKDSKLNDRQGILKFRIFSNYFILNISDLFSVEIKTKNSIGKIMKIYKPILLSHKTMKIFIKYAYYLKELQEITSWNFTNGIAG